MFRRIVCADLVWCVTVALVGTIFILLVLE
jgi:hypothetical protein